MLIGTEGMKIKNDVEKESKDESVFFHVIVFSELRDSNIQLRVYSSFYKLVHIIPVFYS